MPNFPAFPTSGVGAHGGAAPGSTKPAEPAVLTANFGGRYSQRTGDGINSLPRDFAYKSALLIPSKIKMIDDFLKDRKGYLPFTYLVPFETVARQFICPKWTVSFEKKTHGSISATFQENFDP